MCKKYRTLINYIKVRFILRPNHAWNVISPFQAFTILCYTWNVNPFGYSRSVRDFTLSGIHDFVCSVHLDARPNHAWNVISPFWTFTISCVTCILMHDQTKHGTWFPPFRHSRFCATHETLTLSDIHVPCVISPFRAFTISYVACILMHDQTKHGT